MKLKTIKEPELMNPRLLVAWRKLYDEVEAFNRVLEKTQKECNHPYIVYKRLHNTVHEEVCLVCRQVFPFETENSYTKAKTQVDLDLESFKL